MRGIDIACHEGKQVPYSPLPHELSLERRVLEHKCMQAIVSVDILFRKWVAVRLIVLRVDRHLSEMLSRREGAGIEIKLKGRLGDLGTTEILARVGAISDYLMSQCKMDSEETGEKVSRKREMGQY